jgi:hypothetical protein
MFQLKNEIRTITTIKVQKALLAKQNTEKDCRRRPMRRRGGLDNGLFDEGDLVITVL